MIRNWIKALTAVGCLLPVAGLADSDVGGASHNHAGKGSTAASKNAAPEHHTMHDGLTDQSWEFYGALYIALQSNDPGDQPDHDGNQPASNFWLT